MKRNDFSIIDAHCHIYPDRIALKATTATAEFYSNPPCHEGTTDKLLQIHKVAGIESAIICSPPTTPKQVKSINSFLSDAVIRNQGHFAALGALHPYSENLYEDFDSVLSHDMHGIKIHPDIQKIAADDKVWFPIYEFCEDKGLPVLMHTGDYRFCLSNPDNIIPILKRFPRLVLVGAHLGYCTVWDNTIYRLLDFDNFYTDCSACFYTLGPEKSYKWIREFGTERVAFGSDYPAFDPGDTVNLLLDMDFTEGELKDILYNNAKKVYHLND